MELAVITGAISRAELQSKYHHQQTNIQFFRGRMPFMSPNQHCQSTEGKISHSLDLFTPSSPGGLPTLSLTTNSSWLPWGRVAMPLISPLMPVPQIHSIKAIITLIITGWRPAQSGPIQSINSSTSVMMANNNRHSTILPFYDSASYHLLQP